MTVERHVDTLVNSLRTGKGTMTVMDDCDDDDDDDVYLHLYRCGPCEEEEVHDVLDPLTVHRHEVDDLSGSGHPPRFVAHRQRLKRTLKPPPCINHSFETEKPRIIIIHSFYIALLSALEQTHCAHWYVILNE